MSSKFREKFKASKISKIKEIEKEAKDSVFNNGDGIKYLSIDEGNNKFRIYPATPDYPVFAVPVARWWMNREITYTKEGKEITEVVNKPVFNGVIHSKHKVDIVDEYVKFAKKHLAELFDNPEELKEQIKLLTHWQHGLRFNMQWAMYADKIKGDDSEFGLLTVSNAIKNKLNELAISDDDEDVISTDPFTDPDTGKAIIIKYNKDAVAASDKYKVNIEFKKNYSLTDEQLEHLQQQKTLSELYVDVYSRRDFDIALECLKYFDNSNDYGILDNDEFIEIVEKISELYPVESENTSKEDAKPEKRTKVTSPVKNTKEEDVEEIEDEVDDEAEEDSTDDKNIFASMNRLELKKYIKANDLDINVTSKHSDDDIRDMIVDYIKSENSEEVKEVEEKPDKKISPIELAKQKLAQNKNK